MNAALAAMENERVWLVNISTEKWPPRSRTYFGSLQVNSPAEGQEYAVTPIRGYTGHIDMGDRRNIDYRVTAREVAEDLARELNGDSGEGSFHGVFVAATPTPSALELADAHQKMQAFQRRLVAAADLEWERSKNPMFITDLERRAAKQLRLDKPWLYDAKPSMECPACGERIKDGVAVCRACRAILDPVKAAKWGLHPPAAANDGESSGKSSHRLK